jgi:hypothetical protein
MAAQMAAAEVYAIPFSLELTVTDKQTGAAISRKTVARRANGDTAEVKTQRAGSLRRITYLSGGKAGQTNVVSEAIKSKTLRQENQYVIADRKRRLIDSPADCASRGATFKRWARVSGERVAVVEMAAEGKTLTYSMAPALGCEVMAYTVTVNGKVVTEAKATEFRRGSPAAGLFRSTRWACRRVRAKRAAWKRKSNARTAQGTESDLAPRQAHHGNRLRDRGGRRPED